MFYFWYFIFASCFFIYLDVRYRRIADRYALCAIMGEVVILAIQRDSYGTLIASVAILLLVFVVLLATPFAFGGGDLRYGILVAPLVEPKDMGWFFCIAGAVHTIVLLVVKKRTFAFIPAMFIAALGVYFFHRQLWKMVGFDL